MINDDYLKYMIEEITIEILVHSKCQETYDKNINVCKKNLFEYLINSIETTDYVQNKNIYISVINELIDYCVIQENSIITTNWNDLIKYKKHIEFIYNFQNKYKIEYPIIMNYKKKPFGNILLEDIQDLILKKKFNNELLLYNLYKFILKHTITLLSYLEYIYNLN